jgi:hypothetical protein
MFKEPGRRAQTKSYMWAQMNGSGPPVRLFAYAPGRGAVHAEKLYAKTTGANGRRLRGPVALEHRAASRLNAPHVGIPDTRARLNDGLR